MKGFVYNGPGNITLQEIPLPLCGDNDIIIKNLAAGICHSDINAYQHDGPSVYIFPGLEFGHEMVSEVAEVGKNVQGLQAGDRMYPYPLYAKDDMMRPATVGGFSEYIHVPNCRLDLSVFRVDDAISNKAAAMIEPFTVGGHSARICNPGPGKKAMVFGSGISGMSAAITLDYLGCDKVMVVNRSTYRLGKAVALGFATCSPVQEDLKAKSIEYFGKSFAGEVPDIDIFIDATGAADSVDHFFNLAKRGAVLSVVGVHHTPAPLIDLMKMTYGDLTIKGSPGYALDGVPFVMELMKSGKYDLESLTSHTFPLEQLEEAIQAAAVSGASEKVLIEY